MCVHKGVCVRGAGTDAGSENSLCLRTSEELCVSGGVRVCIWGCVHGVYVHVKVCMRGVCRGVLGGIWLG